MWMVNQCFNVEFRWRALTCSYTTSSVYSFQDWIRIVSFNLEVSSSFLSSSYSRTEPLQKLNLNYWLIHRIILFLSLLALPEILRTTCAMEWRKRWYRRLTKNFFYAGILLYNSGPSTLKCKRTWLNIISHLVAIKFYYYIADVYH